MKVSNGLRCGVHDAVPKQSGFQNRRLLVGYYHGCQERRDPFLQDRYEAVCPKLDCIAKTHFDSQLLSQERSQKLEQDQATTL